jgi:DnaK suppressor protein
MVMDKKMLNQFKVVLENRWQELSSGMEDIFANMDHHGDAKDPKDIADQASSQYNEELSLRIQYRNRQLIRELRGALIRIEDGSFGICEECGDDIGVGRLKVHPMATLCVNCKRKLESQARLATA